MVLTIIRVLFILLCVYAAFLFYRVATEPYRYSVMEQTPQGEREVVKETPPPMHESGLRLAAFVGVALLGGVGIVTLDARSRQKSLGAISGVFFGLLAGLVIAYGLGLVVDLLADAWWPVDEASLEPFRPGMLGAAKLSLGLIACYITISLVIQTKDDFRFVIPYVEFAKQTKGIRPMLLDTSVIIDGRIADIAESRLIDGQLIVPRFVLRELQAIADSSDKLKRNRGRRGLDVLNRLQGNDKIDVAITEATGADDSLDVDHQLVSLAKKLSAKIATNDYNLNKIAQLQGLDVININDLAGALRPVVLPGETINVRVIKPGEEVGQGIGYLDDGTMVVGEQCRDMIGQEVGLTVTSVLQTSAGRMIFGRREGSPTGRRH